jgi:signal transduction histidine kinase
MRWPLRYQILLPFAAVMLASVLSVSLIEAYLAARRTQAQIERQLRNVAQTLLDANFPLTDAVLKQMRGLSGAEFVLLDNRGRVQASTLDASRFSAILPAEAPQPDWTSGEVVELAAQQYFHAATRVPPRAGQDGPMALHILYPRRSLQDARWQAAYPPILVGSVVLGAVILLASVIAGRLSLPILELRRQLSRLVRGDFQPVPLPKRNDELRDLVDSVNVLAVQLAESRRAIERTERLALLGQLSGGLAHQLRNSVTGARLAVQLHQRRCAADDHDSLVVALRQLTLTESHLQRFLTVGQPTVPRRGPCDLKQIAADVAALVAPACKHRSVDLQLDLESESPAVICADGEQLTQLLLNLVLNGIEAAGNGGWVRIAVAVAPQATTLRVFDSGPGPDQRLLDRLFEAFVTAKPEGIGLGLTVAKRTAEAHGGTVRYVQGRPTCFEVVLPTLPQEPAAGATPAARSDPHQQQDLRPVIEAIR